MVESQQIFGPIHQIGDQISTPAFTAPLTEVTWRIDDCRVHPADQLKKPWIWVPVVILLVAATWGQQWVVVIIISSLVAWAQRYEPTQGHLEVTVATAEQQYSVQIEGPQVTPAVLERLNTVSADTKTPLDL